MINFQTVPAYAVPKQADWFTLFEAAALLQLEGQWIRLTAADQRALIGGNVFGKQEFMVNDDSTVTVRRSTCFGMDSESQNYTPATVREAVSKGKRLSPGTYGAAYL